ncbi:hypothetical protein AB1Y20_019177 [Prymnesium parvum]|uniref:Mannan endo-1,4-beta-mannosidase n=1 Tax=Prymnesium parvum TaxID=97485 RepID=A0AB34JV17_PRYPA
MHFRAALPFAPKSPGCSLGAIALSADCDTFAQATATTSLYQSPAFALSAFTVPLFLPLPSAFLQTTLPFALADAAPACSLSALALAADRDAHASITATSSLNHQPDFALLAFTLPLLSPASTALLHTALPFGLVSAGYSLSAFARTAGRDPLAALTTSTSTTPSAFDLLAITLPHLSPAPAALLQTSFPFIASGGFRWDGQPVFLNGVNQAWLHYGNDFGGHQTHGHYCALRETLHNTSRHGGHAIRVWLHVEGDHSPLFDKEGFVVATDAAGTLIADLRRYLQAAQQLDVLVFLVLWNGAVLHNQRTRGLFSSAARLQSYVERVLAPLAAALRAEPALGGWEVINEPEGLLAVSVDDPDGCFNATPLRHSGAGWALPADPLSMRSILGFIGAQAAAIHRAAPGSLVTVGAWSERTVSGALGLHDFYTAKCLRRASGGQPEAYLDFLQVHSYASRSKGFSATSPFKHAKADYALKAPLVIGEFCPGEKAEGMTAEQLYQWAFDKQYDGGWGWTATSKPSLFSGMAELKNEPKVAAIKLRQLGLPNNSSEECDCFDEAPLGGETCQTYATAARAHLPVC